MPHFRFRRAAALGAASLIAGTGLAGLAAAPAFAASVTDTTSLNNAIASNAAVIDIDADFILTADIAEIDYSVEINGNGNVIDADGFEGFDLDLGAGETVSITGISLVDAEDYGIYADAAGDASLTVTDSSFTSAGNTGIYFEANDESSLTVSGVTTTENGTYGIYFESYSDADATFTVSDSVLSNNDYAGLYFYGYGTSSGVIEDSDLSGNADYGLYTDMYEDGMELEVYRSTLNDNGEYGVYFCDMSGVSYFEDLTIDGNVDTGVYGSLYSEDGGQLTLNRSTVSNNGGGGLYFYMSYEDSTLDVINSTISGNDGDEDYYGAIEIYGDDYEGQAVTILNSTVTANENVWTGLYVEETPTLVSHSIISGNDVDSDYADVYIDGASDVTIEWSIVTVQDDSGLDDRSDIEAALYVEGDNVIISADPGLAPLADNGGLTLTHLPLETSAAIDGGNPDITDEPATDQRGNDRIVGSAIDIGSVEVDQQLAATGIEADAALAAGLALMLGGLGFIAYRSLRRRAVA